KCYYYTLTINYYPLLLHDALPILLIQSTEKLKAPDDFTSKVMQQLPVEKKHVKYLRWFKMHPILTAAAIFFVFMFTGLLSAFEQDRKSTRLNSSHVKISNADFCMK